MVSMLTHGKTGDLVFAFQCKFLSSFFAFQCKFLKLLPDFLPASHQNSLCFSGGYPEDFAHSEQDNLDIRE
jgi:hypothetical protein